MQALDLTDSDEKKLIESIYTNAMEVGAVTVSQHCESSLTSHEEHDLYTNNFRPFLLHSIHGPA